MIPPHRKGQHEENVDSWLMSYADMITLLLCFFIIFVSVSEPKKEKLSAITEGMAGKFGTVDLATPFQGVFRSLQAVVETHQILKDVAIEKGENNLVMELSSLAFYKAKTAEFDGKMLPVLEELANTLKSIEFMDYRITVEGHTNDLPISTPFYPSNWELSSARAARMVRFFIDHGIKENRLKAVGYADTKPKVPNLDINGNAIIENRKLNERVIIKLEQVL
jgi:chemotaxis protein MotB